MTPKCACGKELLAGIQAQFNAKIGNKKVCPDCYVEYLLNGISTNNINSRT